MLLLGLDFETTGLDVEKDLIIEVGAVVWDTERKAPIDFYSSFVTYPHFTSDPLFELPKEIVEITGIDTALVKGGRSGVGTTSPQMNVLRLAYKYECPYLIAHNARGFDRPMLRSHFQRSLREETIHLDRLKWIDTRTDIPYPKSITTRNLKYLLAEHGILNPFPHRALTDTLCMMTLLSKYDIEEVIGISQTPNLKIKAIVSYECRQQAKDRSFHWDASMGYWHKLIKKNELENEEKLCQFPIKVLEEIAP